MIRLTKHAKEAMALRRIALEWVESTIAAPERIEADPRHPDLERSYKAIPAFGGRVLRVVHRRARADIIVITVHFDRGARG
jgi:hypothetical protein